MALQYLNRFKSKRHKEEPAASTSPVLSEEDELFLCKITSEEAPPPLPPRPTVILDNGKELTGEDAQSAELHGADKVPLPQSPPEVGTLAEKKKKDYWSRIPGIPGFKNKDKEKAADNLKAAAEALKNGENADIKPDVTVTGDSKKEEDDLTAILDQLNLSAVNNRVFSFSKESQELLEKFKLVLKDLVNGAPTAYNDLESLLTNSEDQLKKLYGALPPFLQSLVKSLPKKMTSGLGPEVLAATAEKPGLDRAADALKAGDYKNYMKSRVPNLKSLVSQQGAVAGMLRSILNFLKLRFPTVMTGTNILMSLAVFLLLFVFWYCHKRGRETRLEKERLAADGSESDLDRSASDLEDSIFGPEEKGIAEPPITIQTGPGIDDKPSASVADMPSVLHLPSPGSESQERNESKEQNEPKEEGSQSKN